MITRQSLLDRKSELEQGIVALQALITRAKQETGQAEANLFANQGAIQQLNLLLAQLPEESNVVLMPELLGLESEKKQESGS